MEQFGLAPFVQLMSRLHWFLDRLAGPDGVWWMKLAIVLALVILVVQLIGSSRKADEQKYWRMYR
jgi:heme/copper-type cytochrome/quinol oxidase subunit 4